MATFIKAGFWETLCAKCTGYKGWLNLDQFVNSRIPAPTYKVYTALLTQSGGDDPLIIYEGDLTIGVTYSIDATLGPEYDFSNVGGPKYPENFPFVATGTTPNNWGAELLYNTGAPVVTVLENTIGNIWFSYEASGVYIINNPEGWDITKVWYGSSGIGESGVLNINPGRVTMSFETDLIIVCYNNDYTSAINGQLINTPIEIRVYN